MFESVEEVMKFVRLYSKVAYRFTGMPQRENIYEYPFEAIREAVINSVMHKYYFEHGHNNILKFFPDRIRIENYWQKAMNYVRKKGNITNKEYVEINNISRETAKRDLSDLVEKSVLKIEGKGRGMYYVIGS